MDSSLEDTLELVHYRHSRMLRNSYVQELTKVLLAARQKHQKHNGPEWQFAAVYHHIHRGWSDAKREVPDAPTAEGMLDQTLIAAILRIWGLSKAVYHFHPSVIQKLLSSTQGNIPHEALRHLPQWCPYIHLPPGAFNYRTADGLSAIEVKGFYAMLDTQPEGFEFQTEEKKVSHLLHLIIDHNSSVPYEFSGGLNRLSIPLAGSIQDSVEMMASGQSEVSEGEKRGMVDLLSRIINPLLYLAARNREIKGNPSNPEQVRFDPPKTKHRSLARKKPVQVWEVAWRVGAALESSEQRAQDSQPTGATVRPHVRRAHFHHYWCGPNKERCEVRWVGPIFVKSRIEDRGRPVTSHSA